MGSSAAHILHHALEMIRIIETMQIVNKQITEIARGVLILFQDPPAARIVAKAADQKVT